MNKKVVIALSMVCFVMSSFAVAQEEQAASNEKEVRTKATSMPGQQKKKMPTESTEAKARRDRLTSRGGSGRSAAGRDEMYREMLSRQGVKHQEAMKELEDIKKIAEEEGATKTLAAIQALIDQKGAEYQASIERFEKARSERAARVQERLKEREAAKEAAAAEKAEKKAESEEAKEEGDD